MIKDAIKPKLKLMTKPNSSWLPFVLIFLVIIFFSIRLVITYDSAHYLNYVSIFEGNLPASSWDIVRGPVFPAIIFLFDAFFGKTGTGILVGTFLFYLIFAVTCHYACKEICKHYNIDGISMRDTLYKDIKDGKFTRDEITPDGLHPNDLGHRRIAEKLKKFMEINVI